MQQLESLGAGFMTLGSHPMAILLAIVGVALGIIVGATPGLSVAMGVAIALPFTFGMDPVSGILLICGIFFGGVYGGSITSILLRIPGTPASAAITIDGNEMVRRGEGGIALSIAAISSYIGGTISVMVMVFLGPVIAGFALNFSAAETFALAVFGLSVIAGISAESPVKGIIAGILGLIVATVGLDPMAGMPRFTGGMSELYEVPLIPVMIGLFAMSEAFRAFENSKGSVKETAMQLGRLFPGMSLWRRLSTSILRSTGIGTIIGMVPGAGSDIAGFVAYNEARRFSKTPETFGKGEPAVIASCEASASACTGGALLTMLTLGIPGDAVTAIMLGALTLQGLQPGPLLFEHNSDLVFTLFAGMLLCYLAMVVMGLLCSRIVGRVVRVPRSILTPSIIALCTVGTYALNNSMFDVYLMLIAGGVGYFMQKWGFPASPVILALIMGPMAEANFRRALSMSGGSYDFLYTRPITVVLLLLALFTIVMPFLLSLKRKLTSAKAGSVATNT